MGFIAIDLGTTNIKVAAYDEKLTLLAETSNKVDYLRSGDFVEFDALQYYDLLQKGIKECAKKAFNDADESHQIILTGQAESLVILDNSGMPVRNAISWLDERSKEQCAELQKQFSDEMCFAVTGQVSIIPTWPITKILWLKQNEPESYKSVAKYLLLKDYIQFRLTNKMYGDMSIYNFSLYFDIHKKEYWKEILSYCGVSVEQLPELVEPQTNIGAVTKDVARELGVGEATTVNVGTLDHFAGMIGTGNIKKGVISESTGTVLSVATVIDAKSASVPTGIPCHYGFMKDSYVMLSVCESGGVSLEWFKQNMAKNISYSDINEVIAKRGVGELIFLPYLTGINAPDYSKHPSGVFFGLKLKHDVYDMAHAVMEGVAHMLASNIEKMQEAGVNPEQIISTGGGARSDIWSKLKSNITGCEIHIPENEEAACLGAAIIGAVDSKVFESLQEGADKVVAMKKRFSPENTEIYRQKHELFNTIYSCLSEAFVQHSQMILPSDKTQ